MPLGMSLIYVYYLSFFRNGLKCYCDVTIVSSPISLTNDDVVAFYLLFVQNDSRMSPDLLRGTG
jgi:hypothetical protein